MPFFQQTIAPEPAVLPDYGTMTKGRNIPVFKETGAYAGIASIPRREKNLRFVLETLYGQMDHFFIYLNGYDSVPNWMEDRKVTVFRSQDYIDMNATGKVFFAERIDKGFFFTLDDDFLYPGNYVAHLKQTMANYDNRVAACVHGSIFPENPEYYYMRTAIYQYQGGLKTDRFVCLPGTGSFAVNVCNVDLSLRQFLPEVMVDLTCAILCKNNKVPLVCVSRPHRWLRNTDREGLYQQFTKEKTHHTHYAMAEAPWDFSQYSCTIRDIMEHIVAKDAKALENPKLDHDAFIAARRGIVPGNWQNTPQYYARMAEYYRSMDYTFKV
ncbi:MAG: hypothetical protein GDA53_11795 [Rhodobacteraceae bacterium]|nr:hypothetical protein [Paracoccaceae bacterium]